MLLLRLCSVKLKREVFLDFLHYANKSWRQKYLKEFFF